MESNQKENGEMVGAEVKKKKKSCTVCKTTETPLWRSGPSGPKTLCNACGIKYSKKRPRSSTAPVSAGGGAAVMNEKTRNVKGRNEGKLMPLVIEVEEGYNSPKQWGEVERAALLLMALSCGVIFT